jgi:transcriptional regulator with XRE-family HTH domain
MTAASKKSDSGQAEKATTPIASSSKAKAPAAVKASKAIKGSKAVQATSSTGKAAAAPKKLAAIPKAQRVKSSASSPAISRPKGLAQPVVSAAPDSYTARVRKALGVSRTLFARMTGFSERAIAGWELGAVVSESGLRRVKEMDRLRISLAEVMREDFIPKWLTNPCEELGGLKPVEVLERGEADRLWRTVLLLGSGMPT